MIKKREIYDYYDSQIVISVANNWQHKMNNMDWCLFILVIRYLGNRIFPEISTILYPHFIQNFHLSNDQYMIDNELKYQ